MRTLCFILLAVGIAYTSWAEGIHLSHVRSFASNPANCAADNYAEGVDEFGVAECLPFADVAPCAHFVFRGGQENPVDANPAVNTTLNLFANVSTRLKMSNQGGVSHFEEYIDATGEFEVEDSGDDSVTIQYTGSRSFEMISEFLMMSSPNIAGVLLRIFTYRCTGIPCTDAHIDEPFGYGFIGGAGIVLGGNIGHKAGRILSLTQDDFIGIGIEYVVGVITTTLYQVYWEAWEEGCGDY